MPFVRRAPAPEALPGIVGNTSVTRGCLKHDVKSGAYPMGTAALNAVRSNGQIYI